MFGNDIGSEIYEGKTHIDDLVNQRPSGSMELVLQDLVCLGKTDDPLHVNPLGGDDPISNHSLCRQLIDPSHRCWCINLDVVGGEQILYLKEIIW